MKFTSIKLNQVPKTRTFFVSGKSFTETLPLTKGERNFLIRSYIQKSLKLKELNFPEREDLVIHFAVQQKRESKPVTIVTGCNQTNSNFSRFPHKVTCRNCQAKLRAVFNHI